MQGMKLTFKVVRRLGVNLGVMFRPMPSSSFFVDKVDSRPIGRAGTTAAFPGSMDMAPGFQNVVQGCLLTINA